MTCSLQNLVESGFTTGLVVDAGSNVALANATIAENGDLAAAGGGINNAGTLTIVDHAVSGEQPGQ